LYIPYRVTQEEKSRSENYFRDNSTYTRCQRVISSFPAANMFRMFPGIGILSVIVQSFLNGSLYRKQGGYFPGATPEITEHDRDHI
jgi:hypothetical protein